MYLLNRGDTGDLQLTLFMGRIPPYAILSHTWGKESEEVDFKDIKKGIGEKKKGYEKILFCEEQARKHSLNYFWIDTCCIDKTNSNELFEAINSMFKWYSNATRCYAYLSDVLGKDSDSEGIVRSTWKFAFRESRWFRRGWTLQELLAPLSVEFFSEDRARLGDKTSLGQLIREITTIPTEALQGQPPSTFSVQERLRWAENRETTRPEDAAYCLQGLFEVCMVPLYSEGKDRALARLQDEIKKLGNPSAQLDGIPTGQTVTSEERDKVMESLQFEEIDDRYANIKRCHQNTCKWLLQTKEYQCWLASDKVDEHHGFLWIKGKPGSGKSTLTKFAFQHFVSVVRDTLLINFFFNARGSALEKTAIGLYRSLLFQLLKKCPETCTALDSAPRSIFRKGWTIVILQDLLEKMIHVLGNRHLAIFIDALDECNEEEVRDMVLYFERLGCQPNPEKDKLRICLSSRHYPQIVIEKCVEIVLEEQEAHSADIRSYLRSELKIGHSQKVEHIREEICTRAAGIFMWVVLVVQILNRESAHGRVYALQKKLRELPTGLNELFRDILTRDNHNWKELELCLQWVLHANRPLHPEELYFAILSGLDSEGLGAWDRNELPPETLVRFVLSSSKGLAEVTKSKKPTVQFIHESVRDFLLGANGFNIVFPERDVGNAGFSHDQLKQCCVNYMAYSVSKISAEYTLLANAPKTYREEMLIRYPFLSYAVQATFQHANNAAIGRIAQDTFLKTFDVSTWVKLQNITEQYQIRRHPEDISLLYLLAEANCAQLISTLVGPQPQKEVVSGRWKYPILAALANKSLEALLALLKIDFSRHIHDLSSPCGHCSAIEEASALVSNTFGNETLKDRTSLIFLAEHNKLSLVSLYISVYEIDINVQRKPYGSALQAASVKGHEKVVELLLAKGANVNIRGSYDTALQAALSEGHEKVVELLLAKGADVNIKRGFYGTALQTASSQGHEKIVELLLAKGADVNTKGGYYATALQAASSQGHEKIVELLLAKGADVNAKEGYYDTALQAASSRGHEKIVELLLAKGADVNAKGGRYATALQAASSKGYEKIVELLLAKGAIRAM